MLDTSILERKIHAQVMDMCFKAIVTEAFVGSLPIHQYELDDGLTHDFVNYANECLEDLGSVNLLRDAMKTSMGAAQKAYVQSIYDICYETATTVTGRILEENKNDDDALKDAADNVALTPSEYKKFSSAASNLTPTTLTNMIQKKTLDTIKEEQEAYKRDSELETEIVNAINAVTEDEDEEEDIPESMLGGGADETGSDIGQDDNNDDGTIGTDGNEEVPEEMSDMGAEAFFSNPLLMKAYGYSAAQEGAIYVGNAYDNDDSATEAYMNTPKIPTGKATEAFHTYMKSIAGDNYRHRHSSMFSKLQELAYEGILASMESYDQIPFETMKDITIQNTFSKFQSHSSKNFKSAMESISRYDFKGVGVKKAQASSSQVMHDLSIALDNAGLSDKAKVYRTGGVVTVKSHGLNNRELGDLESVCESMGPYTRVGGRTHAIFNIPCIESNDSAMEALFSKNTGAADAKKLNDNDLVKEWVLSKKNTGVNLHGDLNEIKQEMQASVNADSTIKRSFKKIAGAAVCVEEYNGDIYAIFIGDVKGKKKVYDANRKKMQSDVGFYYDHFKKASESAGIEDGPRPHGGPGAPPPPPAPSAPPMRGPGGPEGPGGPPEPDKKALDTGLLTASIIYTFFETLNSMNLYCPKLDEIRNFVDETLPVEGRVELDKKTFAHFFKKVIGEAAQHAKCAPNTAELDVVQKDMDIVREKIAAPGFENSRNEIEKAVESVQRIIDQRRDYLVARNKRPMPVVESYFETMSRTRDVLKFNRTASLMAKKPNVTGIKYKIDPQGKSNYVAVEAYNMGGSIVNKSTIVLESVKGELPDYVEAAIRSSNLMDCGKTITLSDSRSGRTYMRTSGNR